MVAPSQDEPPPPPCQDPPGHGVKGLGLSAEAGFQAFHPLWERLGPPVLSLWFPPAGSPVSQPWLSSLVAVDRCGRADQHAGWLSAHRVLRRGAGSSACCLHVCRVKVMPAFPWRGESTGQSLGSLKVTTAQLGLPPACTPAAQRVSTHQAPEPGQRSGCPVSPAQDQEGLGGSSLGVLQSSPSGTRCCQQCAAAEQGPRAPALVPVTPLPLSEKTTAIIDTAGGKQRAHQPASQAGARKAAARRPGRGQAAHPPCGQSRWAPRPL